MDGTTALLKSPIEYPAQSFLEAQLRCYNGLAPCLKNGIGRSKARVRSAAPPYIHSSLTTGHKPIKSSISIDLYSESMGWQLSGS